MRLPPSIFQENLDPNSIPEEKVIKRLIYGAVSSGNQAERAIRETARLQEDQYPEVSEVIHKHCYVDDCISRKATNEIKHFVKREKYENISKESNGILYYSGCVLPNQEFSPVVELTGICQHFVSH